MQWLRFGMKYQNNKFYDCPEMYLTEYLTILRNDISVSLLCWILWHDGSPLMYEIQCLRFVRTTYHSPTQNFAHALYVLFLIILTINGICLPKQHKLFAIHHAKAVFSIRYELNCKHNLVNFSLQKMNTPQISNACGIASCLIRIIWQLISVIQMSDVISWGLSFLQAWKSFSNFVI